MNGNSVKGLTNEEAKARLKKYGFNEIRELFHISPLRILLKQVKKNFIIYLLLGAMLISFLVGKVITAYTIMGVITLVILVGFIQEYRAERAVKALKAMMMPVSVVIRDGREQDIPSREMVPGDVIVLRAGEKIPADCVVLEAKELRVNEAMLTGESHEVEKTAARDAGRPRKESLVFMGTFIVGGRCMARVLHTGMNTEFGKIAGMISTAEKELPLQAKVNRIAKFMATTAIIVSVLTGVVMVARSATFSYELLVDVLMVVIALSVSAFPEGFPVVLITTLASGAYRMARKNAIVNRMSVIETLGETTVICTDKTGTVTTGEMTVKRLFADGKFFDVTGAGFSAKGGFFRGRKGVDLKKESVLGLLLKAAILCNDSRVEKKGTDKEYCATGSPTEAALLIMAAKAGMFREDLKFSRMQEIPFSSERKMMSVLCRERTEKYVYAKGAPDILLGKCRFMQKQGRVIRLDDAERKRILAVNGRLTSDCFRVLALAYRKTGSKRRGGLEESLVFLGLAALEDPPRDEVRSSIRMCRTAGIRVKMLTGDSKETAVAIGKQVGLSGKVMDGEELDKMTDDELSKAVNDISFFARVRPEHKIRIVRALKKNGEIVTMTGDGVNDAPALKEAHIGVAMGKGGTDVSREAADLTLKDDNFATIVSAVREGRTIFNNIRKFVTYQLSCNYAELMIIFIGVLIGLPLPLLALQILFMNLVTDDLPAITLGFNPPSRDAMREKPRKKSDILDRNLIVLLAIAGIIMASATLGVFHYTLNVLGKDLATARTTALVTLILFEIANAFNFRSFRHPVCRLNLFANKYLIYASIASIMATALVVYTPLNAVFGTVPISPYYWLLAAGASLSVIIAFDVLKVLNRKKRFMADLL
ncbi:MAG: cation-transporting P-type ATPase [Candidatus Aenigmatarchaeota archaeon]